MIFELVAITLLFFRAWSCLLPRATNLGQSLEVSTLVQSILVLLFSHVDRNGFLGILLFAQLA